MTNIHWPQITDNAILLMLVLATWYATLAIEDIFASMAAAGRRLLTRLKRPSSRRSLSGTASRR